MWKRNSKKLILYIKKSVECENHGKPTSKLESLLFLFNLPSDQILIEEFFCNIRKHKVLKCPGKLYLFTNYICFYSNIFGMKTMEVIPFAEVLSITKKESFPGVSITTINDKKYTFKSFCKYETESVRQKLLQVWKKEAEPKPSPLVDSAEKLDPSHGVEEEEDVYLTAGTAQSENVSGTGSGFLSLGEDALKEIINVELPGNLKSFFSKLFFK